VQNLFPVGHVEALKSGAATVDAVLNAMARHRWVHLACHGAQHSTDPTLSAFALHDGALTLRRLMAAMAEGKDGQAELAVLSACQTAAGDETLAEEAVHLVAGMLAVGYKSVVGTMWSIRDADAPSVADALYACLLRESAGDGRMRVARALHEAVRRLKEEVGEDKFVRWVPFVHFGL